MKGIVGAIVFAIILTVLFAVAIYVTFIAGALIQ
ncbi:hypothetical protein [Synechococcus phage Ssp-JY39]|nr:hypothetical protein [Synechococcus phage Yong-M2-251]